ncbi:MAG: hypothetical protein AB9879_05115 [Methanothrix sp.]
MCESRVMEHRRTRKPPELKDKAKEEIAAAIAELDEGSCRTFSDVDELFDDLDSD